MNGYAVVVLTALVFEGVLEVTADVLNVAALSPDVPAEFRDVYDPARYRRSQEYTRARTHFGILVSVVNLAIVLVFWFAGGFEALDRAVRALGRGPIVTGLLFVGVLAIGRGALNLPARWWSTFVLEERFGFNTTTQAVFWSDLMKGLALALAFGTPLVAVILWFFGAGGQWAWLWAWVATALVLVGLQILLPAWIMPLFNRFTPLGEGDLRDAILAYARSVRFSLDDVFVIDGSRRSTKANAFFTGFGRHKRVALFDTLVERLRTSELVAVVAHEIGHYRCRHVLVGLGLTIAHLGLMFFLLSLFLARAELFRAFYVATPSVYVGIVLFTLLLTPIELALSIGTNAFSRRNEFAADAFAARTTGAGEPLAQALKHLSTDSLSNLTPHWLYVVLRYSHPPVLARIHALRSGIARHDRGGS
jgi:STE24 endopeptidase